MIARTSLRSVGQSALERAFAPPSDSLIEAREALAYWREREAGLPWHRRAARAEARAMVARWRERLVSAQLDRWGLEDAHPLAPVVSFFALPRRQRTRLLGSTVMGSSPARRARRIALRVGLVAFAICAALAGDGDEAGHGITKTGAHDECYASNDGGINSHD
jgi:hypothetical protein